MTKLTVDLLRLALVFWEEAGSYVRVWSSVRQGNLPSLTSEWVIGSGGINFDRSRISVCNTFGVQ